MLSPNSTQGDIDKIKSESKFNNIVRITPGAGVSNVTGENDMTLFMGDANSQFTPFHEFGHYFGLADRYAEVAQYAGSNIVGGRSTIPLDGGALTKNDPGHNPNNNAYSNSSYTLTNFQINTVMRDINYSEKDYNHGKLFLIGTAQFRRTSTITIQENMGLINTVIMNQTNGSTRILQDYVKREASGGDWIGSDRNLLNQAPAVDPNKTRANNNAVSWY